MDNKYHIIFEGMEEGSEDKLAKVRGIFIADFELTINKVIQIFDNLPISVLSEEDLPDLMGSYYALKDAGAKVYIVDAENKIVDLNNSAKSESEVEFEVKEQEENSEVDEDELLSETEIEAEEKLTTSEDEVLEEEPLDFESTKVQGEILGEEEVQREEEAEGLELKKTGTAESGLLLEVEDSEFKEDEKEQELVHASALNEEPVLDDNTLSLDLEQEQQVKSLSLGLQFDEEPLFNEVKEEIKKEVEEKIGIEVPITKSAITEEQDSEEVVIEPKKKKEEAPKTKLADIQAFQQAAARQSKSVREKKKSSDGVEVETVPKNYSSSGFLFKLKSHNFFLEDLVLPMLLGSLIIVSGTYHFMSPADGASYSSEKVDEDKNVELVGELVKKAKNDLLPVEMVGESVYKEMLVSTKIKIFEDEIVSAKFKVFGPEPRELTPEEIVVRKKQDPWLKEFFINDLDISTRADGLINAYGAGYGTIEYLGRAESVYGNVNLVGKYNKASSEVTFNIDVDHGALKRPDGSALLITEVRNNFLFSFTVKGEVSLFDAPVEKVLVPVEEKKVTKPKLEKDDLDKEIDKVIAEKPLDFIDQKNDSNSKVNPIKEGKRTNSSPVEKKVTKEVSEAAKQVDNKSIAQVSKKEDSVQEEIDMNSLSDQQRLLLEQVEEDDEAEVEFSDQQQVLLNQLEKEEEQEELNSKKNNNRKYTQTSQKEGVLFEDLNSLAVNDRDENSNEEELEYSSID